jgi:hypothetical protein
VPSRNAAEDEGLDADRAPRLLERVQPGREGRLAIGEERDLGRSPPLGGSRPDREDPSSDPLHVLAIGHAAPAEGEPTTGALLESADGALTFPPPEAPHSSFHERLSDAVVAHDRAMCPLARLALASAMVMMGCSEVDDRLRRYTSPGAAAFELLPAGLVLFPPLDC